MQLQVTVLYAKFLLAGKSKQTRGVTALRDIGLTMGRRERRFWNRAESLEIDCTSIFMKWWRDQDQPVKNKPGKREIKGTDHILAEASHHTCQTKC